MNVGKYLIIFFNVLFLIFYKVEIGKYKDNINIVLKIDYYNKIIIKY